MAKGLCDKHYARNYQHGNPHIVSRIVGENRTAHPLYKSYHAMLDRCYNSNNKFFSYYGGRGIDVDERWRGLYGFTHFIEDMGAKPKGMTLDRKDNDEGYSPGNCVWATRSEQQYNQRTSKTNTSGHKGVSLFKKTGKWQAYMHIKGKRIHGGYHDTMEQAIAARMNLEELSTNERDQ